MTNLSFSSFEILQDNIWKTEAKTVCWRKRLKRRGMLEKAVLHTVAKRDPARTSARLKLKPHDPTGLAYLVFTMALVSCSFLAASTSLGSSTNEAPSIGHWEDHSVVKVLCQFYKHRRLVQTEVLLYKVYQ